MTDAAGNIVAIAGNPYSGAKSNRALVEALMHALSERGLEPVAVWEKGELAERAGDPEFASRCRCVVAAGGDGTLLYVVNTETNLPVLHFPLGNENLFAGHWRIGPDPVAVAKMIETGQTTTIDLGSATSSDGKSTKFTCVASAGFDAEVVHRLDRWRARGGSWKRVKRTTYTRPILATAMKYCYPRMTVTPDDGEPITGTALFVFNLPRYGMGLPICPDARGDDGLLDYVVFTRRGALPLMSLAMAIKRGTHAARRDVRIGRAKRIRVDSETDVPLEVDGDPAGCAPVTLVCLPAIQKVIVPG